MHDFEKKSVKSFCDVLFLSDLPAAQTDDLTDTVITEKYQQMKYRVEACPLLFRENWRRSLSVIFTSFRGPSRRYYD